MQTKQTPIAVVEIYNEDGFVNRVDFTGPHALSAARRYVSCTGELITSGRTVVLSDLIAGESGLNRFSTFIPDGMSQNDSRLREMDAQIYSHQHIMHVFIMRVPRPLASRNPLHPEALRLEDLKFGLKVQRYHDGAASRRVAVIASTPFSKGNNPQRGDLWVQVMITSYSGKAALEDWSLGDMGVVPYTRDRWNSSNYTLAV